MRGRRSPWIHLEMPPAPEDIVAQSSFYSSGPSIGVTLLVIVYIDSIKQGKYTVWAEKAVLLGHCQGTYCLSCSAALSNIAGQSSCTPGYQSRNCPRQKK